jgi:hypothetical protein
MIEYLTTKELSKRIKYTEGSIRNLVYDCTFINGRHYVKPKSGKLLFIWSAVEAWLHGTNDSCPDMIGDSGNCLIKI